jgi:hypothetical protein
MVYEVDCKILADSFISLSYVWSDVQIIATTIITEQFSSLKNCLFISEEKVWVIKLNSHYFISAYDSGPVIGKWRGRRLDEFRKSFKISFLADLHTKNVKIDDLMAGAHESETKSPWKLKSLKNDILKPIIITLNFF